MVRGSKTPAEILRAARARAREREFTLHRKVSGGKSRGKGSHQVWQLLDQQGTVLAQSIVPGHSEDVAPGTLRSIEKAFEPVLGRGWLDRG